MEKGFNIQWWILSGLSMSGITLIIIFAAFHPTKTITLYMDEICDNAIDDDGDGLIDINDPDCICEVVEPISRIPNPSFEETNCCPQSRSQLNCANNWIQASEATTDLIHDCGWSGWPEFVPPRPFPSGEGIVGFRDGRVRSNNQQEYNWKEYAGACLTAPLLKGETYRFEFYIGFVNSTVSPWIDVTFFGAPACDILPFGEGNNAFGCPTNASGWVRLGSVQIGGNNEWVKTAITVIPNQDINAIAIGPSCANTTATVSTYYFFDELILDDNQNFEFTLEGVNHPCNDDFSLQAPIIENATYQWYNDGMAMVGETRPTLENVKEGNYNLRIIRSDGSCKITKQYIHHRPVIKEARRLKLCEGDTYQFGSQRLTESGDYTEKFISKEGCDSIVDLTITGLTTIRDTLREKIFSDESFTVGDRKYAQEGEHITPLVDRDSCDYYVHLFLEHFRIYTPNIFSPNGDGQNDIFYIYGEDLERIVEMSVYDRWGNRVWRANDLHPSAGEGWDGRYNGKDLPTGIYTYIAHLQMNNLLEKQKLGEVMLVR